MLLGRPMLDSWGDARLLGHWAREMLDCWRDLCWAKTPLTCLCLTKKTLNFGEKSVRVLPTELVLFCNCKSLVKVFLEAKVIACTSWVSGCLLALAGNCCGLSKQNLTPVWV